MPRKACVTAEEIFEAVKDNDVFNSIGILKSRSDPVWLDIHRFLKDRIQITNLYLFLKQNRNGILSRILEYKGIKFVQTEDSLVSLDTNSANTTERNETIESVHTDDEQVQIKTDYKCSSILYDIIIDAEMWQRICPKSVIYKEHGRYNSTRQYFVLQRGWTDILSKLCWIKTNLKKLFKRLFKTF